VQQLSATMSRSTTCSVETILSTIRGRLVNLASAYRADVDDLQQDVAMALLEMQDKMLSLSNPYAYAIGIARFIVRQYGSQQHHHSVLTALSLDAPLAEDMSLLDVVASPSSPASDDRDDEDKKAGVVYDALRRLPLEEQLYICDVYQLHAYIPAGQIKRHYDLHDRSQRYLLRANAYRHLRQDGTLAAALEEWLPVGSARWEEAYEA
jgi:DNA-directed RNA polymerase specialized sigma24 family protein